MCFLAFKMSPSYALTASRQHPTPNSLQALTMSDTVSQSTTNKHEHKATTKTLHNILANPYKQVSAYECGYIKTETHINIDLPIGTVYLHGYKNPLNNTHNS